MVPVQPLESTTHNTQSLGGISYSLRKAPETTTWTGKILSATKSLLALPVVVPLYVVLGVLFTVPPIQNKVLGVLVPTLMDSVGREFQVERSTLLKQVSGRVLDLGSGGGAYLDYCQNANEVVAVEPLTSLHPTIVKRGVKNSLQSLKIVSSLDDLLGLTKERGGEEDEAEEELSYCFDWIIIGNVLCEVPCIPSTLNQIHRLLKPGGHVYFSEHIGRPIGTWQRRFQNIINPLWRHVGGGCNCNRDTLHEIYNMQESEKSWDVISWMYPHVSVCLGPFVLGLAQKKKEDDERSNSAV